MRRTTGVRFPELLLLQSCYHLQVPWFLCCSVIMSARNELLLNWYNTKYLPLGVSHSLDSGGLEPCFPNSLNTQASLISSASLLVTASWHQSNNFASKLHSLPHKSHYDSGKRHETLAKKWAQNTCKCQAQTSLGVLGQVANREVLVQVFVKNLYLIGLT